MGAKNLGEAVIVDIAVNGLQPSLKQTVIQKSPKTFEELRNSLEIATNVAECASSNTPCTSQDINAMFSSFLETMKSAFKQEVFEVMAVTPHSTQTQNYPERQETRQYRQEYVCFGCGKKMGMLIASPRREYSDFQSSYEPEDVIPSVNLTSISSQENSEPLEVNFVYTPTNTSIPSVMAVDAENADDTVIETNPEPTQIQEIHTEVMPENIGPLQKECYDFKHVYAYLENGTLPDETKLAKKICLEASQYSLLDGILYHFTSQEH
ncbi:unnamed protein product [Mytilus coruscus]|uniref:Uncharacterized protein n=1 Tax=Mytilus coruscus TaxID=42192 RepID=A0A6J8DXW4_MYTCO|nr:unnamed protein product [Mytilus coruscus]